MPFLLVSYFYLLFHLQMDDFNEIGFLSDSSDVNTGRIHCD